MTDFKELFSNGITHDALKQIFNQIATLFLKKSPEVFGGLILVTTLCGSGECQLNRIASTSVRIGIYRNTT